MCTEITMYICHLLGCWCFCTFSIFYLLYFWLLIVFLLWDFYYLAFLSRVCQEISCHTMLRLLFLQVYQRSYDICMQLYEKEILTDSSYLHIYGYNCWLSPRFIMPFNCMFFSILWVFSSDFFTLLICTVLRLSLCSWITFSFAHALCDVHTGYGVLTLMLNSLQ